MMDTNILDLILNSGIVVKFVMLMLLAFSVVSWAIIILKYNHLRRAANENLSFATALGTAVNSDGLFAASKKYTAGPMAGLYRAGFMEKTHATDPVQLRRALKRSMALESARLERYISFLATCGSSSPFIGLFGTVWGIMNSFIGIGKSGAASLAVVAPGIAEALIATAMGLVAAIPAVIAYNYFVSRTRYIIIETEDFSEEIVDFLTKVPHAD